MKVTLITGPVNSGKTAWLTDFAYHNSGVTGVLCSKVLEESVFKGYDLFFLPSRKKFSFIREKTMFHDTRFSDSDQWFTFRRFMFNHNVFKRAFSYYTSLEYSESLNIVLDEAGPMEMEGRGFYDILVFLMQQPGSLFLSVRPSLIKSLPEYFNFVPCNIIELS